VHLLYKFDDKAVNSIIKIFLNTRNLLLYSLIYCLVQQRVYQSRVTKLRNCWTFGTPWTECSW